MKACLCCLAGVLLLMLACCSPDLPPEELMATAMAEEDSLGAVQPVVGTFMDSLPAETGTMADTTLVRLLSQKSRVLRKARDFEPAMQAAKQAVALGLATVGDEDSLTVAAYVEEEVMHRIFRQPDSAMALSYLIIEQADKLEEGRYKFLKMGYYAAACNLDRARNYAEAIRYFQKYLQIDLDTLQERSTTLGRVCWRMASTYRNWGRYRKAIEHLKMAIDLWVSEGGEANWRLADFHGDLGNVYTGIGYYDSARFHQEIALSIRKKEAEKFPNKLALSYQNLGRMYFAVGKIDTALALQEEALSIYLEVYGPNHRIVAGIYADLGNLCKNRAEFRTALSYYKKALHIYLNESPRNLQSLAYCYSRLGTLYQETGEVTKAETYLLEALNLWKKTLGEDHPNLSEAYNNLGNVYLYLGQHHLAEKYFDRALVLNRKFFGTESPEVSINYHNLGYNAYKSLQFEQAIGYHQEALAISQKLYDPGHPAISDTYNSLGLCYAADSQFELAAKYLDQAMAWDQANWPEGHPERLLIQLNYYRFLLLKHDFPKARKKRSEIANIFRYDLSRPYSFPSVQHPNYFRQFLLEDIFLYSRLFETSQDSAYIDTLLEQEWVFFAFEEYVQNQRTENQDRSFYLASRLFVYENAVDILSTRNAFEDQERAFVLAEKTKSRQLASDIHLASLDTSFGLPDSLRQQEHRLNVDLAYYEKKAYQEEFDSEAPNDSLLRSYRDRIFSLKEQRDALIERFRRDYPDYYQLRYSQAVLDVAGVQDSLLTSDDQALLEYFVGDSAIYAFLLRRDTLVVRKIERDFPLEQWVEELRCGLFAGRVPAPRCASLSPDSAQALYARRAHALYQKLVAPLDSLLPEDGHLTLVPDGVLGYLPFAALLRQAPSAEEDFFAYDYWLRHHRISYAYSATLQQYMRAKRHRQAPQPTVLAVAPRFDGEPDSSFYASRFIDPDLRRGHLTRLDYNDDEVRRIGQFVRADTLTGTAATREAFLAQASGHRVLHLATHGKANDQAGDNSFLAFYLPPDDSAAEPLLYNRELYNLDLNADLVVLSACETGIGELQRGEGIISLARGFSYAGAKSIVTSLWSVNDQATQVLMTQFYAGLRAGLPKHEALRQAKLRLLQSDNAAFHSPFFWAAFIPIGDMEPVELAGPGEGPWLEWLLMGGLALLGLGLWGRSFARRG